MSNMISTDSIVDVMFHLIWKSNHASHTDCYQASSVNIWRDHLPQVLLDSIMNKQAGEHIELRLKQGEILPDIDREKIFEIKSSQFDRQFGKDTPNEPYKGRFYPKGVLKGITNVFRENIKPFRVVSVNNGHLEVDFNHPLAGKALTLAAIVGKVTNKCVERGGSCTDWIQTITDGPGMQARWKQKPSEYFSDVSFAREDETPDVGFTAIPESLKPVTRFEVKRYLGKWILSKNAALDGTVYADLVSKASEWGFNTAKLIKILYSLKRVRVVAFGEDFIQAEFVSAIFRFVDDVEFYMHDRNKVIHVRSASRVGYYDLGVNRRRVEGIRKRFEQGE